MLKYTVNELIVLLILFFAIVSCKESVEEERDYRQEMRKFVIDLSQYADGRNKDFIVIPQNGQELVTYDGSKNGAVVHDYLKAIDGTAREDLLFGYENDNEKTNDDITSTLNDYCRLYEAFGVEVFVVDYCSSKENIDYSYTENYRNGFVSFAADDRNLTTIPTYPMKPYNENGGNITSIHSVQNFLYLINSEQFETKADFIETVSSTYYDMIVIDLFHFGEAYSREEILGLTKKPNGNRRMVICYMSIGEAENYRFYWKQEWKTSPPSWLGEENGEWEGNYTVDYWNQDWQAIIYGTDSSYLDRILSAGYDGVWLDLVDAYENFELSL